MDSLENAIPLLVGPCLVAEADIGSTSTSVRDHPASVFGTPLPFRLREPVGFFAAQRQLSLAQRFNAGNAIR